MAAKRRPSQAPSRTGKTAAKAAASKSPSGSSGRRFGLGALVATGLVGLALGIFIGIQIPGASAPRTGLSPAAVPQAAPQAQAPQVDTGRIQALERQAQAEPQNLGVWVQLGNAYFDSDMPAQSATAYEHALEIDPNNADVWTDLGVMYRRSSRFHDAVRAFDRALALRPDHQTAQFNKGVVLLHDLNQPAEALQAWEAVLAVNPSATAPSGVPLSELVADLRRHVEEGHEQEAAPAPAPQPAPQPDQQTGDQPLPDLILPPSQQPQPAPQGTGQ